MFAPQVSTGLGSMVRTLLDFRKRLAIRVNGVQKICATPPSPLHKTLQGKKGCATPEQFILCVRSQTRHHDTTTERLGSNHDTGRNYMHAEQQLNDSASHGTTANLSFDGSTRDIYDMDTYDNIPAGTRTSRRIYYQQSPSMVRPFTAPARHMR